MKTKTYGYVVISEDGKIMYDFTFSQLKRDAIRKYTILWENQNWNHHYRKGVRCINVVQTIETYT